MKNNVISMMTAALVALSFVSCQKDPVAQTENTITMRLHASSSTVDTRTSVSENQNGGYDINWSADDQVQVIEFVDNVFSQDKTSTELESDSQRATFVVSLGEKTGTSFLYETVFPASAYGVGGSDNPFYRLNLSDKQTFSSSSFDGSADLLISEPISFNEQPRELDLKYKRIGAAGRMVLKGITEGEKITKVVFSTEEDGYIAGFSKFDPTTAEFLGTYSNGSKKSIELTPSTEMTATGEDVVWFRLYAITLTDNFKVVVTTDTATYTKEVNLAGRTLAFNDGGLTKFNVAFSAENRESNSTAQYVLVTDASSLSAGDIIRLGCAAKGKAAGAMGANSYFASVDATFSNGVMTSNDAIDVTLGGSAGAWTLTTSEGQITTSAAKALKLNDGKASTWTISISDEGAATITASSYGNIQYNSGSPRFLNYTSAQSSIEIYKLNDGKQNQTLSFDQSSIKAYTNDASFNKPTLSGAQTTVTYSSSNTSVATVDSSTGAITIVGAGTTTISADAIANDSYRAASASYEITVVASYASLSDLVDSGDPTSDGRTVRVYLTNEPISSVYVSTKGDRVGVYVPVGNNNIYLYKYGVPSDWGQGGLLTGCVEGNWKLYNSNIREIELTSDFNWTDLSYTEPEKTLTDLTWIGYTASYTVGAQFSVDGTIKAIYDNGSEKVLSTDDCTLTGIPNLSAAGTTSATISYTEGGVTKTATATITVTAGSGTGTDQTVTWTATSGALGTGIGSGTIKTGNYSWNYTRTLKSGVSYTGWTSNCIQLGKNGGVENISLSTSNIPGTIKSVSVECSSYNNAHKVSISVGGTSYISSTATAKWTTVGTITGTGTSSGDIVINITDGTRALYIKSISVTYAN